MERHEYSTPGLEVVEQDIDNLKSNLTVPPASRDMPPVQQPTGGYFAPPVPNAAQSAHAAMMHDQAYVPGRQHGTVDGYGSAPMPPHATDAYYNSGNHHYLDPSRATATSHTAQSAMGGAPMSDAGLSYSPIMSEKRHDRQRTVCGMLPATFFLSLALAVVVLVAAIGGGVGGAMAVKEARSNALAEAAASCSTKPTGTAATTTGEAGTAVTSTSSQKFKSPGLVITELDCPAMDQKPMVVGMRGKDVTFTPQCGTDYYINQVDVVSTVAYSFENCVRACAALNSYAEKNGVNTTACIAVVFNANMLSNVETHGGNCWLKSKIGAAKTVPGLDTVAAALLKQS